MVPNMAYKPPIMLGGLKDPIWDKYIKHEGTRKDPIEGHKMRHLKDPMLYSNSCSFCSVIVT